MLKKFVILVVVLVVGVLIFAATKPAVFRVQRTAAIKAPPAKIFAILQDFHDWSAWSPYDKLDPNMNRSYGPIASGLGATYAWNGNNKVGAGSMRITGAEAPSKLVVALEFTKPFKSDNTAEYTLEVRGDSTYVTWAMYGPNHYIGKVMSVFVNVDKMVGKQFEEGLSNLKALAEKN